jgi:putative oxygen-independent coproporphyrinogen III oxidase
MRFPTAPVPSSTSSAPASSLRAPDDAGFGVYVHWPFCAQKCPYCDFNSHVRFGGIDEARFLSAYLRELEHTAALTGPREVASIFFGGGTPSLMQPRTVAAILDRTAQLWSIAPGAEITLEANPGSVEAERFAGYAQAGVNRVSLGVQSLRDDILKSLGRIHTAAEAMSALKIATEHFDRISFDLIYARPRQTVEEWRRELSEALELAHGHLSLYQLTIEPETPFAALHAAGKLVIPEGDEALALYEATQELTTAAGLPPYEISNHAAPGEESRHNLLYWRYGEYAGCGPGAHGRLVFDGARHATSTERFPERWAELVEHQGFGWVEAVPVTRGEQADELLLMGLRLGEGIDLDRLAAVSGLRPRPHVTAALERAGLIERVDPSSPELTWHPDDIRTCVGPGLPPAALSLPPTGRIRATKRGRFVLNEIVLRLSASFAPIAAVDAG